LIDIETRPPGTAPRAARYEWLLNHFERYKKFRQFINTREAILTGERLFDNSEEELSKWGLMTPLAFNLYETTLAAIPAAGLAWIFQTITHVQGELPLPEVSGAYWQGVFAELNKSASTIEHISKAFIAPVLLLAVAVLGSWASLHSADSTKETRKRCRDAFLYYDGAHGLYPQMFTSLGLVLMPFLNLLGPAFQGTMADGLGLVVTFPLLATSIWQAYVLLVQIPRNLFELNGYHENEGLLASPGVPRPWKKFLVVTVPLTFIGIPVLAFVLEFVLLLGFAAFVILKIWLGTLL
jgi:hypothetical protein